MDEEVTATLVGRDEAVALLVVEPLDGSGWHPSCTFLSCTCSLQPRLATCVFRPEGPGHLQRGTLALTPGLAGARSEHCETACVSPRRGRGSRLSRPRPPPRNRSSGRGRSRAGAPVRPPG